MNQLCPQCNKPLKSKEKLAKNGNPYTFIWCSGFPECTFKDTVWQEGTKEVNEDLQIASQTHQDAPGQGLASIRKNILSSERKKALLSNLDEIRIIISEL